MIVGVVCRVAFIISRSLAFVFLHSSGRGGGISRERTLAAIGDFALGHV